MQQFGDGHHVLNGQAFAEGEGCMGPVQAVRSVLRQTFRFSGRARRSEFWWWVLAYVIACSLAGVVDWRLDPEAFNSLDAPMIVSDVVFYGLLLPHMAVTARRLHDVALSTWWLLLHLLPFGVVAVVVLCASDGWKGPTRYGPDPRGRPGATAATDARGASQP